MKNLNTIPYHRNVNPFKKLTKAVLLLLFIIFFSGLRLYAQHNFREGYIVTLKNDTIKGLVKNQSNVKNYHSCFFNKGEKVTEYLPSQINGFGYTDDKFFASGIVKDSYAEAMVSGSLSLYKMKGVLYLKKNGKVYKLGQSEEKGKNAIKKGAYAPLLVAALYSTKADAQTVSDSLWGANNSTPDSVAWNMYSRPNIRQTYGKESANPTLNWDAMTASEKYNYFAKDMENFFNLYNNYETKDGHGNTILTVNNELCTFYTNLANYVFEGKNNIDQDNSPALVKYSDIEKITKENNGVLNLPHLVVIGTSNLNEAHAVSGVYLAHRVNDTTTLKSLGLRDSRTNYPAAPGDGPLIKTGNVNIYWYGYQNGQFVQNELMEFNFDKEGNSHLIYADPKLYMIDPKTIQLKTESPGDKTINYTDAWQNYVGNFKTTVNQDTTQMVNTDDGAGTTVSFRDYLKNTLTVSRTPLMSGEAGNYNFVEKRKNLAEFIQDGFQTDIINYNGKHFHTQLKVDSATQTITVRDLEAPTGNLRTNDTTIMDKANALEAALATVYNVKDNSNGTVNITDTLTYDSDSLQTYLLGLQDVTKNYKRLGFVDVHFGTTGINDIKAQKEKYGIQKVWPNPFMQSKGNNLFFDYKAESNGPVEIDFMDLSGRRVMTYTKQVTIGKNRIEISMPYVTSGTYLLNCKGQNVKVIVK